MLNYRELNDLLRLSGSSACAADCHGFLSAQSCITEYPETDIWQEYLDLRSADEAQVRQCHEVIHTVLSDIRKSLLSADFDFQLLIPDDDAALPDRVDALSEWCHGFLNGFAPGDSAEFILATEDGRELIENFTRICHIGAEKTDDESDEQALFELIEYVRLGAIYIYDSIQAEDPAEETPEVYH